MKRQTLMRNLIAGLAILGLLAIGSVIVADSPNGLRNSADSPVAVPITDNLPPVARGPMTITPDPERALSVLSFDDGTCEGGLGAGVTVTDLVDFDVPTQCTQGGLDIVGVTARVNTVNGSGHAFAFSQAGATPPAAGAASTAPIGTDFAAIGPCPGSPTSLATRAVGPSAAVITGTANFFAGIQGNFFAGRDTSSPSAGRIWLLCPTCGMTTYSPTDLIGFGLGGNWMIRVTVEDANCVPVELMGFSIDS